MPSTGGYCGPLRAAEMEPQALDGSGCHLCGRGRPRSDGSGNVTKLELGATTATTDWFAALESCATTARRMGRRLPARMPALRGRRTATANGTKLALGAATATTDLPCKFTARTRRAGPLLPHRIPDRLHEVDWVQGLGDDGDGAPLRLNRAADFRQGLAAERGVRVVYQTPIAMPSVE